MYLYIQMSRQLLQTQLDEEFPPVLSDMMQQYLTEDELLRMRFNTQTVNNGKNCSHETRYTVTDESLPEGEVELDYSELCFEKAEEWIHALLTQVPTRIRVRDEAKNEVSYAIGIRKATLRVETLQQAAGVFHRFSFVYGQNGNWRMTPSSDDAYNSLRKSFPEANLHDPHQALLAILYYGNIRALRYFEFALVGEYTHDEELSNNKDLVYRQRYDALVEDVSATATAEQTAWISNVSRWDISLFNNEIHLYRHLRMQLTAGSEVPPRPTFPQDAETVRQMEAKEKEQEQRDTSMRLEREEPVKRLKVTGGGGGSQSIRKQSLLRRSNRKRTPVTFYSPS